MPQNVLVISTMHFGKKNLPRIDLKMEERKIPVFWESCWKLVAGKSLVTDFFILLSKLQLGKSLTYVIFFQIKTVYLFYLQGIATSITRSSDFIFYTRAGPYNQRASILLCSRNSYMFCNSSDVISSLHFMHHALCYEN